jgi:hypothetical protein
MAVGSLLKKCAVTAFDLPARIATGGNVRSRNVLITAIPRSGSSLFVNLINQIPNCVALNEISYTSMLFSLFRTLRRKIERGEPVVNKYSADGQLATNTIIEDTHFEERAMNVQNNNFLLAHKLTTTYLNRLEELVRSNWRIWVLVRHPLYTLGSWKRCPPHFTITQLNPPHPSLAHIEFSSDDGDIRRVEVWNHYARRIHDLRDSLEIVRYEDLISDVNATIRRFCQKHDLSVPQLGPLESRNRPDVYSDLDDKFRDLVGKRCESWRFGYAQDSQSISSKGNE